jgi:hypothetical protein
MKSILREYIRAALIISEADDKYTTSSALISGLQKPGTQTMPAEIAERVATANAVIVNNLAAYLAETQIELDYLENTNILDMSEKDFTGIYQSIATLLLKDADHLKSTKYPIMTALYLIALDENMPDVSESIGDFLSGVLSSLKSAQPGQRPNIKIPDRVNPAASGNVNNENRNRGITEGAIWDGVKKSVGWVADKAMTAGAYTAKPVTAVVKAGMQPSGSAYKKLAKAISNKISIAINQVAETYTRGATNKIQLSIQKALEDQTMSSTDDATYYSIDDLGIVAEDLLQIMESDVSKTVESLTDSEITTALRSRLPSEISSLSTDEDMIKYVKEVIRLADLATGGTERFVANLGPARITFATAAVAATAVGATFTGQALQNAATIAPNADITNEEFAKLVAFEKLTAHGTAAADRVASKLNNADVYTFNIDMNKFSEEFAKLIDYMHFDPFKNPVLQPGELRDLGSKMWATVTPPATPAAN